MSKRAAFGDRVRIVADPITVQAGFAERIGSVHGETTPSRFEVEVVGAAEEDFALIICFDDTGEEVWFAPHLVELVDHNAGLELTLHGVDRKWVRGANGEWIEQPRDLEKP